MEDPQGVVDQSLLQEHQGPLNTIEERKTTERQVSYSYVCMFVGRRECCVLCPARVGGYVSTHLQKVTSAPSHHSAPLSIKAIDHDHQVNVGVLLLDGAVAPGALHFVVCILSGGSQKYLIRPIRGQRKL